jgi:phosphotransferase system enzyme I (PtsP)
MEVPALLFQLDALLPLVDFMSVGSNDMLQYLFASDRGNPRLGNRYDVLSPPMLNFLKLVIDSARTRGVPVTICGEMAGRPLEAMALIGLGFRSLSMAPASIRCVSSKGSTPAWPR